MSNQESKEKKNLAEVINYLIWGVIAFVLYMVLYAIFTSVLGWKETVATLVDNVLVIIFAFFTNKIFVFKSKAGSVKGFIREFVSFGLARVFTLVLSEVITWVGCDLLQYNTASYRMGISIWLNNIIAMTPLSFRVNDGLIIQLIGQVVVIVTNYVLSKLIVFRKKK